MEATAGRASASIRLTTLDDGLAIDATRGDESRPAAQAYVRFLATKNAGSTAPRSAIRDVIKTSDT